MKATKPKLRKGCSIAAAALFGIALLAAGREGAFASGNTTPANPGIAGGGASAVATVSTASVPPAGDVSLNQRLNSQVALNTPFRDESGKTVHFGDYFSDRPVLLVMPFYKCPGVCTAELDGMARVFQDPRLKYHVGEDFQAVTVSIDPTEGPDLAAAKKREYMSLLGQPSAGAGWHFLTGTKASIDQLASDIGFHYVFDPKTHQYAHPAGLILLTPGGKISKYFYGVEFAPTDLRLALTDAGQGKVGSLVDEIALYCCTYDPQSGTYSVAIFRIIQVAAAITVLLLGGFMALALRRDYSGPAHAAPQPSGDTAGAAPAAVTGGQA